MLGVFKVAFDCVLQCKTRQCSVAERLTQHYTDASTKTYTCVFCWPRWCIQQCVSLGCEPINLQSQTAESGP